MGERRKIELQGHRGARGLFPENTLEGFAATLALGVDAIELDVALTADGIPVVTHDSRLNPDLTRGPDGAWLAGPGPPILSLRLAELAAYDVGRLRPGSRTARQHPAQTPHDGARIPTLASVFALAGSVIVDAEIKTQPDQPGLTAPAAELADAVLAAAAQANALGRLVVRSFDWRGLRHLRRTRPELPLVWLTSAHTVAHAALWWDNAAHAGSVPACIAAEYAGQPAGAGWAPEHAGLTQAAIAEAQAHGLRVLPWTVNDPADMARLIAWGVDGLCTDRPDLAHLVLQAAGLRVRDEC